MQREYPWLLPEGINEVLPPDARRLEALRRLVLDLFESWGYELVIPPLVEYLESLLTGAGHELDLQTFKVTDQMTGRLMGIRADMTPQVARMDAHGLRRNVPTRLCYLGPVLHTLPNTFAGSRNPFQVGAEIYGHNGVSSDAEVLSLMLECLRLAGEKNRILCVDLGHMAILLALASRAGLTMDQQNRAFDLLQRKAASDLEGFCADMNMPNAITAGFLELLELNGDSGVLQRARTVLASIDSDGIIANAISELEQLQEAVSRCSDEVRCHIDLAEVGGYRYYTGLAFAAYDVGQGHALAKGGRYNDIGRVFGRARPATGFSTDLKRLLGLAPKTTQIPRGIFAPCSSDVELRGMVAALRKSGHRVVCELVGQSASAREMQCNQQIVRQGDRWIITDTD